MNINNEIIPIYCNNITNTTIITIITTINTIFIM